MKKLTAILASGFMLVSLTGCSDAKAKLKDSSDVVMTIGNTKVTKGQIYETMFNSAAESTAINDAKNAIAAQEIEITDDMRSSAESTLSYYTSMYGSTFTSYLESSGMTEDDYVNDVLIPAQQADELVNKYIEENFDSLCDYYNPIQATVLSFTTEDDANAALSELKDGTSTAAEAASSNNSSSSGKPEIITINTTSYDSTVLSVLRSASPDDGWTMLPGSSEDTYYVVRVESNTPEDYKDDVISALSAITAVQDDSNTYWFRKYNFHVYDIDLYNAIESADSKYLVQAMADPTPTPAASENAAASEAATAEATAEATASASAEASASASAEAN